MVINTPQSSWIILAILLSRTIEPTRYLTVSSNPQPSDICNRIDHHYHLSSHER